MNGRLLRVIRRLYICKYHQVYNFKGREETTSPRNLHRGFLGTQGPEEEPAVDVIDQSALSLALAPGFSVTLLLPLFPMTSQSIVGHALNALSFHWNLPELNGYVSGAVPDFMYRRTFNTSGGIGYIANTC